MRSPFAYTPRTGPLQAASPTAAVAYLGSLVVVAFVYSNPLVLAAVGVAAALAGRLAGAGRAVRGAVKLGFAIALPIVVVNALVVSRGETVLARLGDWPLFGQVDVTAEAIADGCIFGLRAVVVMIAFAVYSACVDPDRVLRALRPLAGRSALTATLISRLVPVAAADASRLRDVGRLRGPGAAPLGRAALVRRLLAGSLDRSVDVAATLELRGYGLGASQPECDDCGRHSRFDSRFYAVGTMVLVAAVAAKLAGADQFSAYPTVEVGVGAATIGLAAILVVAGFAPSQRGARTRGVGARRLPGAAAPGAGARDARDVRGAEPPDG